MVASLHGCGDVYSCGAVGGCSAVLYGCCAARLLFTTSNYIIRFVCLYKTKYAFSHRCRSSFLFFLCCFFFLLCTKRYLATVQLRHRATASPNKAFALGPKFARYVSPWCDALTTSFAKGLPSLAVADAQNEQEAQTALLNDVHFLNGQ